MMADIKELYEKIGAALDDRQTASGGFDYYCLDDQMVRIAEEFIAAERERCARLLEGLIDYDDQVQEGILSKAIQAIRNGWPADKIPPDGAK